MLVRGTGRLLIKVVVYRFSLANVDHKILHAKLLLQFPAHFSVFVLEHPQSLDDAIRLSLFRWSSD